MAGRLKEGGYEGRDPRAQDRAALAGKGFGSQQGTLLRLPNALA